MFTTRFFQLLILALAVGYVAHASSPIPARLAYRELAFRQNNDDDDSDNTSAAPATTSSAPVTSVTEPADETTSAPADETTSTSEPETSETTATSADPEETSSNPAEETSSSSTITRPGPGSTTTSEPPRTTSSQGGNNEDEEDQPTSSRSRAVVTTSYQTITRTREDGSREVMTSASVITSPPDLNDGSSNGDEGMSTTTRNTVIGVVVGVGGAIILGALGVVFWRLRGRRKQAEENDGLMAYDNTYGATADKSERGTSPSSSSQPRNPFQSTLENYHQPAHPVNTSSNF